MNISTDIYSLFVLLLALFTIGATLLAAYSISNAWRLRNIRLSWKCGKFFGYPLFSTLFLTFSVLVGVYVAYAGLDQYKIILGSYSWMGMSWFLASYFSTKVYVTDHGIVKNVNDPSQTIAWHQIRDYVEKPTEKGSDYIFIYDGRGDFESRYKRFVRLELLVPDEKCSKFDKLVTLKIGKTMSPVPGASFDIKAFD
ncbi:hypothetical protein [Rhodohalobacter barkolensis]|uniref:DUF5673 domain-containing protein n=1 Tax=Rhodohalobacter barkolensis TaxID=2053187 RepID=A0A2N0VI28_9BACT|nr:hypothetical protein [Rhodohalobacter barkolensis]PKD43824.1 hypothetical protein CWD77_09720 [Rhodohalobacter barkolensis]